MRLAEDRFYKDYLIVITGKGSSTWPLAYS